MVTLNEIQQLKKKDKGVFEKTTDLFASFNTGLVKTLGLPLEAADFLLSKSPPELVNQIVNPDSTERVTELPVKTEQIQELGSKAGVTFAPGDEPDDFANRLAENVGIAAPFVPLIPFTTPALTIEGLALTGGTGLGLLFEKDTDLGQKNPEIGRAVGELIGGLGTPISARASIAISKFLAKGGGIGKVVRSLPLLKNLFPTASKRAAKKISEQEFDIERSLTKLDKAKENPNLRILTPAAQEGERGAAKLENIVASQSPKTERILNKQNEVATKKLKERFIKDGNIADARELVERNVENAINETSIAFDKLSLSNKPVEMTRIFKDKITKAFEKSSDELDIVWNKLPKRVNIDESDSSIINFYDDLLADTTPGAKLSDIDADIKLKLGKITRDKKTRTFKRGKGTLFESDLDENGKPFLNEEGLPIRDTNVKALHQFYSSLGKRVAELSQQRGQGNKIRIINKAREAILEDLERASVLPEYKEAFKLTKTHHDKFTKGTMGDIMGFGRGDTPIEGKSLALLLAGDSEDALANIKQALRASPDTKQNISDFLTSQFVLFAKNDTNNKIDVTKGRQFINKFSDTFDELFPELKQDLDRVINKQDNVDFLSGASKAIDASPKVKETSASAFLLGADPGEEMGRLLSTKSSNRTKFATDLVNDMNKDKSGKALKGIKSAFAERLFNLSFDGEFVNGRKLSNSLAELKQMALTSKMFTPDEYKHLEDIAGAFKAQQFVRETAVSKAPIIDDLAAKVIKIPAEGIGAIAGAKLARAGGIGGSLRGANIGSGEVAEFLKRITNDEARDLLARSTYDKKLRVALLTNAKKLQNETQKPVLDAIKSGFSKGRVLAIEKAIAISDQALKSVPTVGLAPAPVNLINDSGTSGNNTETIKSIERLLEERKRR